MKKTILLWVLAFIITAGSAIYQRLTGPSYPVSGSESIAGAEAVYRFERSHGDDSDHTVRMLMDSTGVSAVLEWKRFKTEDPWTAVAMAYGEGEFAGGCGLRGVPQDCG